MATGVKPREEECHITRSDLDAIQDAMKNKKFRELLADYCEEVRDPANQAIYQKEMTQLEKERGYDVTFINPKGGYVIKTSVAGDRKAFINICSNENVGKPSYEVKQVDGRRGMNWKLPYSIIPPRNDFDYKRDRVVIYDVVFHPDTLRMAEVNKQFRELVNKTAFEGLQEAYDIHLDCNNLKFPRSQYKGMTTPAVIRKEDPNYKPPTNEEIENLSPEIIDKLYPQHSYTGDSAKKIFQPPLKKKTNSEFRHVNENGYTKPKYVIKQQKNIDFQEFTFHKDSKQHSAIPSHIVIEINLPLLSSSNDCVLDVQEKSLHLISEKPAKYKLDISLPYCVDDKCGNAKFDKGKRKLFVTLPVIRKHLTSDNVSACKVDSGLESAENSHSDEDSSQHDLFVDIKSENVTDVKTDAPINNMKEDSFLEANHGYILPQYTYNVLDETVAFTFHVKNTEPDSVKFKQEGANISIKFTTIGSGFVPVYYASMLRFDDNVTFTNVTAEAWDNNVILQMELDVPVPEKFYIGLDNDKMKCEYFRTAVSDLSTSKFETVKDKISDYTPIPLVEVTNLGSETNIILSSSQNNYDNDDIDSDSPSTHEDIKVVWKETESCENGAKSILRKPIRSFSESSFGDIASSMDYVSSDCIPEESSLKKTVRFNDVIARQVYRYNSSIEGQKKKNQRKKSKKRSQERRKSESEAEDEVTNLVKTSKPKLSSPSKPRRDSGLADTSDAECDYKSATPSPLPDSSPDYCDTNNTNVFDFIKTNNSNEENKSILNIVQNNDTEGLRAERNQDSELNDTTDQNNGNSILNIVNTSITKPVVWSSDDTSSHSNTDKAQNASKKSDTVTCDTIKHKTDLYNPEKLNKGHYLEVMFKNDLIFDLDM